MTAIDEVHADRMKAIERIIHNPYWAHLAPLLELKPLYRELIKPKWRKRKAEPELRKDGRFSKNGQRMGPLTMAGRKYGLDTVLDIQRRAGVDLINPDEERIIREMWAANIWPNKWSDQDISADMPIDLAFTDGDRIIRQALLVR